MSSRLRLLPRLSIILLILICGAAAQAQTCTPPGIVQLGPLPSTTCAGRMVTLDAGDGWTSYQWSNGGTDRYLSFAATITTSYTVTATDANGCSATSQPFEVVVEPVPPPDVNAPAQMCGDNGLSATLDPPPGGGEWSNINWSISGGHFYDPIGTTIPPYEGTGTTPHFVADGNGPVTLRVAADDPSGCRTSEAVVEIPVATEELVIHAPAEVCPGFGSGTLSLDPPAEGAAWQSVYWELTNAWFANSTHTSSEANPVFYADTSGLPVIVHVRASAGQYCESQATRNIAIRTGPPPVINAPAELCPGFGVGTASLEPPAEGGPWRYIFWNITNGSFSGGANTSSQPSPVFFADRSGLPVILRVSAVDGPGCETTATKNVAIRTAPPPVINAPAELCPGFGVGTASLEPLTEGGPWRYIFWNITNGSFSGGANTSSQPSPVFFADRSGLPIILRVSAVDGPGCEATATKNVAIRTIAPPVISAPAELCPGFGSGTASIAPPAVGGPWRYIFWDITNGSFSGGTNRTSEPSPVFFAGTSGQPVVLRVSVVDGLGCEAEATKSVAIRTIAAAVIDAPAQVCATGPGTASVAPPAEGGAWSSVSWEITNGSFPGGATTFVGESTPFFAGGSALPVGLSVHAYDAHGCMAQGTKTVAVLSVSAAITAAGPTTFCEGGSVTLTASAGATYQWSNGATTQSIVVTQAGSYAVTVTNGQGCSAGSQATTVTVYAKPAATITASGPTSLCPGGSVTLTSSAGPSYLWSTGATTQSISVAAAGTYSVAITSANGCTSTSAPVTITVDNTAPPVISVTPSATCPTQLDLTATVTNAASFTDIYWASNAGVVSINGGTIQLMRAWGEPAWVRATGFTANGCVLVTQIDVPMVAGPSAAITAPDSMCRNGVYSASIPDAGPGATYAWTIGNATVLSGANTRQVSFRAGTFNSGSPVNVYVEVTDNRSCLVSNVKSVPLVLLPTATITPSGPTTFCEGGSVTLSAPAGQSYLWSTGATMQSIAVGTSGSYTVTVTNAGGCSATSAPTVVTVNANPAATIAASGPTTFCEGGSVTLTAGAGASWLWSTGATSQSISVSDAGSYSVTVTNGAGCSTTSAPATVSVEAVPAATIAASGPTTFCEGGSVTLTAGAGGSYLWSTGATSQSISVSAAGSYSVTVTNAAGCSAASAPTVVSIDANPSATITPSGPLAFCPGGSVTLTAGAGASYLWSTGATSQSISVSDAGSYSVTVTNTAGCSATSAPAAVTVNATPAATIAASGPTTFCEGGSVTLTASAGAAWLWSNGATTQSIDVTAAGSYSVTVTNASGCSAISAATAVTVDPLPGAVISASGPTAFCTGGSVTLSAPAGASYLWSTGAATPSIVVTTAGSYSVTVTSAAGCSRASAPVAVTVNPLPTSGIHETQIYDDGGSGTISRTGDTIEACGDPTVRLIPNALNVSYTYLWSTGATSALLDVHTSGTYSVTVTTPSGCAVTSTVTVHYGAIPAKPVIAATGTELCPAGGSITLTAPAAEAWEWSNGATTQSILVTQPGSYTVRVRNGACQSVASDPAVVTTGTSTISTTDSLALCGTSASATLTANAGTSWLWSNGATTQSIVVTTPGTFSVTTTNNGCTMPASSPVTVTQRAVTISASGPTTFCDGNSVTLTANGGTSWYWSTGAYTQSIVVSQSGSYGVTASFGDGCSVSATPVVVEARHVTASIAADRTTVCAGAPIALQSTVGGSAGYTYQWYDKTYTAIAGATSPTLSLTPSASGFVYLKVTDELGCQVTSNSIIYTVVPPANATITAPAALCEGQSATASVPDAGAGTTYSWTITGGTLNFPNVPSVTFTPSGLGSVTLTVTVVNAGCSATSSKTVTVNPLPGGAISAGGPTTFCQGGSVTLTAAAGTSWLWTNGATTRSINVTVSGSYGVTVTSSGCSTTAAPVAVTVNPVPAATVTAGGPTTFCEGGSVTLTASAGSSWLWSNGATTQAINVTQSGSYSVSVTNASGCTAMSAATNVTVNPLPTPTITTSGPTNLCGGSVTLTGHGGTGTWYRDGTSFSSAQSIVVSTAGSYVFRIISAAGCAADSAPVTVTYTPAYTSYAGFTQICWNQQNTSQTLNGTQPGSTFAWTVTGGTIVSGQGTAAVYYSPEPGSTNVRLDVAVTQLSGCVANRTFNIPVEGTMKPAATAQGPTSFCSGGSVTLDGGTAPSGYTYLWSTGATTQSITASVTGSYSVRYRRTFTGCLTTPSDPIVVSVYSPTISASGPTTFCEGGSVTLTASAGSSYLWSNGATTQAINATQSGSYSVSVTNASGCTATSAATAVTVNPLPTPTITTSGPTSLCGGSVTLTGNGGSGNWYRDGVFTSSAQSIAVQFATGSYVFRVTSAAGCVADSAPVTVTYTPSYTSVTAISQICWNQQGTQKLNGAQPGSTFVWTATGGTIVSGQGTAEVVYAAVPDSTNVRLDVTITQPSGCVSNSTFNIQVDGSMKPAVTAQGPTTFCPGGSVILNGGTAPTGYTYQWSTGATTQSITASVSGSYTLRYRRTFTGCLSTPSDPILVTVDAVTPTITAGGATTFCTGGSVTLTASAGASWLWSTGATTQAITVSASGSYSVTVTNANGCSGTSAAKTVTVNPLPAATITAGGPTTFCTGGSVTLTASAGSSYLWSNGATTSSIAVNATGNYSVTVTNANGCSATSSPTSVTVNPLPAATITAGGPATFCAGGSVTLTASAGSSYLWSNGATTSSIAVNATGNYSVTVTNANGCSATSAATAVTVNPLPTATITAGGPTTFCAGGSVTLTASAGSSYLWSNGATTQSIAANTAANYSVTVTNANGCSATSAATAVTVNPLPAATITAGGPTTFCAGGSVTLTASAGSSYLWSNGATTQSIAANTAANYSVTVTNANGCSATSSATAVTVNPLPIATITAGGPTTFCTGGSVTLTASAGSSYLWSTGATTSSIAVNTTGSYSVTVTNGSGCSATSSPTAVTVNPLPTATITAGGPTTFCAGGSVTLTASAGSSYLWSTGATTSSIAVNATGNYTVTVTNASGCSTTSSPTAVTVNAAPTATVTAGGPTTFCAGGSVTLTASAGSSYLWSTGATTSSIAVNATGNYTVTVTNASGCSTTSSPTAVTVNAAPTATVTAGGPTTFCAGGSVTLTASAGASYLWSTGATTQSIATNATGNYSVTVTNASGCSATSTPTSVTVNAPPTATITAGGPATFCTGGSVTLTASAGASYLWSTGATTQSIVASASGNYSVTVTNAAGCSATSTPTSVTVNAKPATPAITPSGPTTFCPGGSVTLTAPAGFTYLWSTGATTRAITVSTSGSYTVTVTNAGGCSTASAPTSVTVNATTVITVQPANKTIARNTSTTLTVTATGTALTYQWYKGTAPTTTTPVSGATTPTLSTGVLAKGSYKYWVRVTGTCGTVNSTTATVTVN
jgi:hypothetical protein